MKIRALMVGLCLAMMSPAAHAVATDPLIEGAKLCTRHLAHYEREYGIPTHLLSAIASTESGRYHEGLKIKVPWPWAINVDGKGYYYDSKLEAMDAVKKFRARGAQSVDVGCMQVNLHHHAHAFASVDQAFDPESNIAYAASFLRALYEDNGHSWKKAAADYHSKTPSLGREYVGQVYDSWYRIIDKLRTARLQTPDNRTVHEMNEMRLASAAPLPVSQPVPKPAKPVQRRASRLPEQRGRKIASYHPPRMNSISISRKKDTTRENGIVTVRPTSGINEQLAVAQPPVQLPSADAKVIHVDNNRVIEAPIPVRTTVSGPHFIFND